jgi:3-hydroxyacyl-CoA dehydrogenase
MMQQIKRAAVLGAGVMGANIAAHLANAGLEVLLLDMVPRELNDAEKAKGLTLESAAVRNRFATAGLQGSIKGRGFYHKDYAGQVTVGNFDDDIAKLNDCDWVVEVVIENLEIKKGLFIDKVVPNLKEGAILTSNTSGLSVNTMAEVLPESVRKNFLVTHFFNPPRYMRLLELVASEYTDPAVMEFMTEFCGRRLGKGVVICKDTPNFIANRIGVFSMCNGMHHMQQMGLSAEEVDAISGPATARPSSALCKLFDLVGIDTLAMVAENTYNLTEGDEDRDTFILPEFVTKMVADGLTGRKAQQGFYRREKDKSTSCYDYTSGEFKPAQKPVFDSVKATKKASSPGEKLKAALSVDDAAAQFAWCNLRDTLLYTVKRIPEIADDIVNVDNAVKWGFGWSLGPFEMLDAYGVADFIKRVEADGLTVPEAMKQVESFYRYEGASQLAWDLVAGEYRALPVKSGSIQLDSLKRAGKVVESNSDASIYDLGDGVFGLEFHSKMNAIDLDILNMIARAVELAETQGVGLVVANQGKVFSAGANLAKFAANIKEKNFAAIDEIIVAFQTSLMALKYSAVPVVAAPFNLALGGGCEVTLHADAVTAHAETNMGLVEIGVGLIPAGGGTKEMALRAIDQAGPYRAEVLPFIQKHFQNILTAKVSTSAADLYGMGLMRERDSVTMDIDNLIADAKQKVLSLAGNYRQKQPLTKLKAPGRSIAAALKAQVWNMVEGGFATEFELEIASMVADIMCGGDVPGGTLITEQYLLDLEREAFMKLCAHPKTLERIEHMLKNGKALRN